MGKKKKENNTNAILYSALGIATGALAAGAYAVINKDKLFNNKKERKSLKQLKDIVHKSKTNVEDILNKMNDNVSSAKANGKAKMDKIL